MGNIDQIYLDKQLVSKDESRQLPLDTLGHHFYGKTRIFVYETSFNDLLGQVPQSFWDISSPGAGYQESQSLVMILNYK
jgi:hypothetical protein